MEKEAGPEAVATRRADPWYDEPDPARGGQDGGAAVTEGGRSGPGAEPGRGPAGTCLEAEPGRSAADIYLEVQRGPAFQEVRRRYRRFVVPASAAFLLWYLAYVVAATTAHDLMARPVAGALNVAVLAGLGQFLTTFLLTWAYVRHARLHRDRAALELRWDTQEMTRGVER
ncbi:DUF485 domain-containing protein [Streptomyces halstedii]|uniref:DUF485 domain-containing protein n=1 Tax=Streptomyces TaxID=1883 RepID=UPI00080509F6|nr:DUF485 domain-containing protein [Streptomyces sp. OspMP-M45]SBU95799.1 Uncharacterized membrane protein, DUF485 family [Streptomyces sp. OspMP-M45]